MQIGLGQCLHANAGCNMMPTLKLLAHMMPYAASMKESYVDCAIAAMTSKCNESPEANKSCYNCCGLWLLVRPSNVI